MNCSGIFKIYKNQDNEFDFIIKKSGNTVPIEIDASDTFFAKLIKLDDLSDSGAVFTITPEVGLNGKVNFVLPSAQTVSLVSERGSKAYRYYLRPTYKLIVECDTVAEGKFPIAVNEVYVEA